MRTRTILALGVCTLLTLQDAALHAQKNTLPKGRPFRLLQQAVPQMDASLLLRVEALEAQLAANAANEAVQNELLGALKAATALLEVKLADTQASVEALDGYYLLQGQQLQQQLARIEVLEAQADGQAASLAQLFALSQEQQSAMASLTNQISFLQGQQNAQHDQIDALGAQLTALRNDYQATVARLQAGCPVDSSIRQLSASNVVCEVDNTSGAIIQGAEVMGNPVTIPADTTMTADAFCSTTTPGYVASGGGVSSTLPVNLVQSVRLASPQGWRVMVRNPNSTGITVQARVTCIRVN